MTRENTARYQDTDGIDRLSAPRMVRSVAVTLGVALIFAFATMMNTRANAGSASSTMHPFVTASPCGVQSIKPHYRHVVWIVMENHVYSSVVASPNAPYLEKLGQECGTATNYVAVAHPSLPNYLALTSGTTDGITDDGEPSTHLIGTPSLFSQLRGNWHALEESMTVACDKLTAGSYAARHNPAVYYTGLTTTCKANDLPLHEPLDLSSTFTFITPNICDDMHSCPLSTGDAWLARFVPQILGSAGYRSDKTALFITWDENESGPSNQVATYVVAPSVPRGLHVGIAFTHYSLLRTTEQLLGLRYLGAAKTATSMVAPFHL